MDFACVDDNLRHMMRFFARASEDGEARDIGGMSIVSSGIDYGVMNSAMLSSPITGGTLELERRIAVPEVHFSARSLRWSFWVCEDLIEFRTRRKAKEVFRAKGFRLLSEPPGMMALGIQPPVRPLPRLDIRRVADATTRFDFAQLVSICFELPFPIAQTTYTRAESWDKEISGYVGYAGGRPVTTAAISLTRDAIGVYSVATIPGEQRKGYAEAIVRYALAKAATETGMETFVLQSSRPAYTLYERMGFRTVTRYWVMLPY
jgi:GNAT superfamily N-acetyltransferase